MQYEAIHTQMGITNAPREVGVDELLAQARAGDACAFCNLLGLLEARLFRQAVALSGDVHAAEDLVSETRIRAWTHLARYNETCRLSTWLYAILQHCHQEAARRASRRPISAAKLPIVHQEELEQKQQNHPATERSPAACTAMNEAAMQLNRCVNLLPEKHREVIQLRFFEDASLPDMAAVLGCSVGTVKSRLHHALEKLRKMKMNLPELGGNQLV